MSTPGKPDDIETLIAEFGRSGMRELHLRCEQFELHLSSNPDGGGLETSFESRTEPSPPAARSPVVDVHSAETGAAGRPPPPVGSPAEPLAEQQWPANASVIRAPYLGTFYRSPKPGAKPYVELGDVVAAGTDLCLVEVMKLFTAVRAESSARVHAILAQDGQLVQGDQPLFVLLPD